MEDTPLEHVDDAEDVARRCNRGHARPGQAVKWQAFVATKRPHRISSHRLARCSPWADCCDDLATRGFAVVNAARIRTAVENGDVRQHGPDVAHANILVAPMGTRDTAFETLEELKADAKLWDRHVAILEQLASMARPLDLPT